MRYEIKCQLPDHVSKTKDATHWVTVDWAHTEEDAERKKKKWQKRGPVKVHDLQKERELAKREKERSWQ